MRSATWRPPSVADAAAARGGGWRRRATACGAVVTVLAALGVAVHGSPAPTAAAAGGLGAGPLAALLATSVDLGPAREPRVPVVVTLRDRHRPAALAAWSAQHGLALSWRDGQGWAVLTGTATAVARAFDTDIRDYRPRTGRAFYAARTPLRPPPAAAGDIVQVGGALNYTPAAVVTPLHTAPAGGGLAGLSPQQLLTAYSANSLASAGYAGQGGTIVFFEWAPPKQEDLDAFTRLTGLPPVHPVIVGNPPPGDAGTETELDLETAHAIAPAARLVVVNATDATTGPDIATLFQRTDAQYPGAVWSLSIGWRQCDAMWSAAELLPVESALEQAEAHGTSAFDASGDTGGLECKGQDYSTPPVASDVGVDAVGSLPAMTSVGGTRVSTDASGRWLGEQTWDYSVLSQGTGGGVANLFPRPPWQRADGVSTARDATHRLLPDVAADADPDTGVGVVLGGEPGTGGGTSQAAPIWAGLTLLMDQYLTAHGGHLLGALNPLLYQVARGAPLPAFHDISLGGNAVDVATAGYDLVTGLGTPVTDNLAQDLLQAQKGSS